MNSLIIKLFRRCCAMALCCAAASLWAAQPVHIGVLAFQSKADTLAQWEATAQALGTVLPEFQFDIVPLNYEELNLAVKNAAVDFVLTNPEHYVVLRNSFRLRPVATLNMLIDGQVTNQFGSVIFTRQNLPGIQTLQDLKNHTVAAVGLYSLGGFLMASDTLLQHQMDLQSSDIRALKFMGLPHTKVVDEVMAGRADVGIVRTGVLEQMALRGQIDLAQVRVLNPHTKAEFPQALSTDLYPEWPWAAMPKTSDTLVKAVALALLNIRPDTPEARAGRYHSFSPPANYVPVEALMHRLKVYPGVEATPLWEDLWNLYGKRIQMGAFVLLLLGVGLSAYLWRSNRHLHKLTQLYREAQSGLKITSAAFDSQVGLVVTNQAMAIARANPAFCHTVGYSEPELLGKTIAQLRGAGVKDGAMGAVWAQLQEHGHWQGELEVHHRDGHDLPCRVTITRVLDETSGLSGFVGSFVDMTEQKKTESEIRQLAFYDTLTELPNRRFFLDRLQTVMAEGLKTGQLGAVLFIDLDHFKFLNDSHGHTVGDELLQLIARRLEHIGTEQAMAARLGGDEFVVLLTELGRNPTLAMENAMAVAETLREAILAPYHLKTSSLLAEETQTLRYSCSGSIGVALFGMETERVSEVLKRADVAMYQAKQAGRNAIRQFDPTAQAWLQEQLELTSDLNTALAAGQLVLHYQLQTVADGRAAGAECLLRWTHPVRGMVPPVEFIPLAEESGAIIPIGEWVLRTACQTLARWAQHSALEGLTLSVNVSPRQFIEASFVPRLEVLLRETGARPERLVLEITEGIVLQNTEQVVEKMHQLRALGIQFSIDDFGTGYSSLSYLQALPLSEIKIDRAFVNDLTDNKSSEAIVRAIIALGQSLNLHVVSEGVETQAQQDMLVTMGCSLFQGYWVARPTELDALEARLLKRPLP